MANRSRTALEPGQAQAVSDPASGKQGAGKQGAGEQGADKQRPGAPVEMTITAQTALKPDGGPQATRVRADAFTAERQRAFLIHLAETANVLESMKLVGVTSNTIYLLRKKSVGFRNAWDAALKEGYVRLEAMMLARQIKEQAIDFATDGAPARTNSHSDRTSIALLGQHSKRVAEYSAATRNTLDDPKAARERVMRNLRTVARAYGLGA